MHTQTQTQLCICYYDKRVTLNRRREYAPFSELLINKRQRFVMKQLITITIKTLLLKMTTKKYDSRNKNQQKLIQARIAINRKRQRRATNKEIHSPIDVIEMKTMTIT